MHHYLQLVAEVSFWQEPLRQLEKIEQVVADTNEIYKCTSNQMSVMVK